MSRCNLIFVHDFYFLSFYFFSRISAALLLRTDSNDWVDTLCASTNDRVWWCVGYSSAVLTHDDDNNNNTDDNCDVDDDNNHKWYESVFDISDETVAVVPTAGKRDVKFCHWSSAEFLHRFAQSGE